MPPYATLTYLVGRDNRFLDRQLWLLLLLIVVVVITFIIIILFLVFVAVVIVVFEKREFFYRLELNKSKSASGMRTYR